MNIDTIKKQIIEVIEEYSRLCKVDNFDGEVIITSDITAKYNELFCEDGDEKFKGLNDYNGFTIPPKDLNDRFTILINQKSIFESIQNNNVNYLGTAVHEAVHVNDFKQYYNIIKPNSYKDLFEIDRHRLFIYWTEFHARAIGHYFLRKHSLDNFKDYCHLSYLYKHEFPYQLEYMIGQFSNTNDPDRQLYLISHFLGRYAVWQYLYPDCFNECLLNELTVNNLWMKELYYFYIENDTVEKFYKNMSIMEDIINKS